MNTQDRQLIANLHALYQAGNFDLPTFAECVDVVYVAEVQGTSPSVEEVLQLVTQVVA